jgi:DNA repair exonuclease SbcCD ATPase subunit
MPDNQTLNQFLAEFETMLVSAIENEEIRTSLQPLGYDEAALQELLDECNRLRTLYRKQQQEYAEQYQATNAYYEAFGALQQRMQRHRRLARIVFDRDSEAFDVLNLADGRENSYRNFTHQVTEFYGVLQDRPDLLEQLAPFSITIEDVESALAEYKELQRAKSSQRTESSQAQRATQTRDEAYSKLRGRMSDFTEVVRIATADRPQLREALGIVTPA